MEPISTADVPISHLDLVAGVRTLQRAAMEQDVDAVHGELCRLHTSFTRHVRSEQEAIAHLSPFLQGVVARGQRRIIDLVDQLLDATDNQSQGCRCLAHSAELIRQLARQVRLENDLFGIDHPSPWSGAGRRAGDHPSVSQR